MLRIGQQTNKPVAPMAAGCFNFVVIETTIDEKEKRAWNALLVFGDRIGCSRGLVGRVCARLERRSFGWQVWKLMQVSDELAREHYKRHRRQTLYAGLQFNILPNCARGAFGRPSRELENAIEVVHHNGRKQPHPEGWPWHNPGRW
jgi:hypothetical protein